MSWLFDGPPEPREDGLCPGSDGSMRDHRVGEFPGGPEGPNEDVGVCMACGVPGGVLRPDGETWGDHLPDCSLPRRHRGHCVSGGNGHPRAEVIRG